MGYTAGTLELPIIGDSTRAVNSITTTVKALNSLNRALEKINQTQTILAGDKLTILFSKLAQATNSLDATKLANFASAAKSLSAITRIGKLENLNWDEIAVGFNKLTVAITPFVDKIKESDTSLQSLNNILNQTTRKRANSDNAFGGLLNIGKWSTAVYMGRKLGRVVANVVQAGADYTETLNLWNVAMDEYTDQATEFVNKINEAYGISRKTLMNAQATFKNMLGSLGNISEELSYQLSESVTRMAIDYASLYNVGIEEAMTKFQAALAGQVRPIRSVSGYDITENTLYQLYQSIGGKKTMRQLNQTEKRLLAIYAIFNQMNNSNAIGDMERTIGSFANQSRIMAESFNEVQAFAGTIITKVADSLGIMRSINYVLAVASETLREIAKSMGALEAQGGGLFEGVVDSANAAEKAIDEVNGKLLGFDEFRTLSGGETETDISIDESLTDAISRYDSEIKKSVLGSREFVDVLKMIASGLGGIAIYFGSQGIAKLISKTLLPSIGKVGSALSGAFNIKAIGVMALISALVYMYSTNEDFRESVNNLFSVLSKVFNKVLEPISKLLISISSVIADILDLTSKIITPLIDIIAKVVEFLDEAGYIEPLIYGIFAAIAMFKFTSWINGLAKFFSSLMLKILGVDGAFKALNKSSQLLLSAGIFALVAGITSLVNAWGDMGGWQRAITIITALTAAIIGAYVAIKAFSLSAPAAIGLGAALAGGVLLVGSQLAKNSVTKFKDGGLPDKGTMFLAGEAGAEIVYNSSNGQSGVANVQQIAQATYQGTMSALRDWWGGVSAKNDIPQLREASATRMYEAVTGVAKSYGNKWDKY